jgi:radical SAM superfamily enzyme YgiQ (UPF0313 family)
MELPSRARGDILLPAGEMTRIRASLRTLAQKHDVSTVIACAFDHRTRILPFIYADLKMAPAGVRAIGGALVDSGFSKTRIVLQQWNKNFSPTKMRLEGKLPDIFMVSSMHLHSSECDRLIREACTIDPAQRPLIIAGGPRMVYEPWQVFSSDPNSPWAADVVVTGEEYVLLSLMEVLLSMRATGESLRATFLRARDTGALEGIAGLVYARTSRIDGPAEELVDTGIQRLLGDLDELPHPVLGYQLLEKPGRGDTLAPTAMAAREVKRHCLVSSLVLTVGCKFRCAYCPIPAYNQRTHRVKSGERVADEMTQIANAYGIVHFFGCDDNFLNDTHKTLDIAEALAKRIRAKQRPLSKIRWGTEATVHDTIRMQEHLPLIRDAGLFAIWMGVEDLTGTLVKKGQSEAKTLEAFRLLRSSGIFPIPMMMHHDTQPLMTWKNNYGILNQLKVLRKAGAIYTQVLMLTPAPGSKWYEETFTSGLAFDKVNDEPVAPHMGDGNYVVASKHARPWMKQLNLLIAYTYFFNPLRLLLALVWSKSWVAKAADETRPPEEVARYSPLRKLQRVIHNKAKAHLLDAMTQVLGMCGLFHTYRRTLGWALRLSRAKIEHTTHPPASQLPMRSVGGGAASHALPGTPVFLSIIPASAELNVIDSPGCSKAA